MKVLVTGGAGYIGSHTSKLLSDNGYTPIVYDNLSRGHEWAVQWGPFEAGDLLDEDRVADVLQRHRVEAVLHFAALAIVGESMSMPELYFRNNVQGSLSLLNAMRRSGVKRLVFSSTCAIYGIPAAVPINEETPKLPLSPYGESKLMVEKLMEWEGVCHGLQWVALRYFNAAGCDPASEIGELHTPETHLIPSLLDAALGGREFCPLHGTDYPTPDGTCIRDYIHVMDLADAHLRALRFTGQDKASVALNLGTGHGYSVQQIIDKAESVTGLRIPIRRQHRRTGDPPQLVAAANRAGDLLGWTPQFSLDDIVETAWRWEQRRRESLPTVRCHTA